MKNFYLFICMMLTIVTVNAQTWNGSVNTDWNIAGNWTGGVPLAAGNVIIPMVVTNNPKFSSNVTINTINM
ncbi:MAG: hypothetical protein ABJA37_14125, partial [Ferruginibacter sp.]